VNNTPKALRAVLFLLILAGVGAWAWKNFGPANSPAHSNGSPVGENAATADAPEHLVVVTYFTSDQRCPTCLKIEKQTRATLESCFSEQLASGEMRFQTLNFDRPENKHFIDDYGLAFKTVVVSERKKGEEAAWEKFDKVWDLVGEPEAFSAYLEEGIRKHLKPKPAPDA
jgi:hypothetical protein